MQQSTVRWEEMLCFNHRVDLLRKLLNSDATATVAWSHCSLRMSRKSAYVAMPIEALAKTSKCYDVTAAVRTRLWRFQIACAGLHLPCFSLSLRRSLSTFTSSKYLHILCRRSLLFTSSESSLYVVDRDDFAQLDGWVAMTSIDFSIEILRFLSNVRVTWISRTTVALIS